MLGIGVAKPGACRGDKLIRDKPRHDPIIISGTLLINNDTKVNVGDYLSKSSGCK